MNNMNFIEACGVLADSAELRDSDKQAHAAREAVRDVVDAYDALEPTAEMWADAPEWAQWYSIDALGGEYWSAGEPHQYLSIWWKADAITWFSQTNLLPGIDWRLCKWQRPGVAP